jgi:hypothetical protein
MAYELRGVLVRAGAAAAAQLRKAERSSIDLRSIDLSAFLRRLPVDSG